jgi:hypothetical protein
MKRDQTNTSGESDRHAVHVRLDGPGPFVTLRVFTRHGHERRWPSRQFRKGLGRFEGLRRDGGIPVWQSARFNWIIGLFFSVGALLFMTGAALSLLPAGTPFLPSPVVVALVFFAGSIPFTAAAYLQHFQSANAPRLEAPHERAARIAFLGWRPRNAGWMSTLCQFVGTVAFNINTFDAIDPAQDWLGQDLTIWLPGMVGSVLFLVSAYLAFMEVCHGYWGWKPRDLDWKIAAINLFGCIAFMIAGVLAFVPRGPEPGWVLTIANANLGLGAMCFFAGAVLLMRESRQAQPGGTTIV